MARSIDSTRWALIAAAAVVAAILGASLSQLYFGPFRTGAQDGVAIGGPFRLTDQTGAEVDQSVLLGKLNLVYFGYTFCPDVCPVELANLAEAKRLLAERGAAARIVFVTIDPERDTPAVIAEYLSHFDDEAVGLTGAAERIAVAAKAYHVYYRKARSEQYVDGYAMDHSGYVYAMDARGLYITHFGIATDPRVIADRLSGGAGG